MFRFIVCALLLFWALPVFAVSTPTVTTPVVVIMDGHAQRTTAQNLLNTAVIATKGDASGTNVSAAETGPGTFHQSILTFTATPFALTDAGTTGFKATKIYTFPEGFVQVLGASTKLACTSAGTFGATGTATASLGTTATTDATLSTTDASIMASVSSGAFVASAGTLSGGPVSAPLQIAGQTTAGAVYLNLADAVDPGADSVLTCSGTIKISWVHHGDI